MNEKLTARLLALLTAAVMMFGPAGVLADSAAKTPVETAAPAEEPTEAADVPDAESDDAVADDAAAESSDERPAVDANVVALIGDTRITADETADLFSYVLEMYTYYGYDVNDAEIRAQLEDLALEAILTSKVQEAMEADLDFDKFTDEEIAEFTVGAQAEYEETYAEVYDGFDDGETSADDLKAQTQAELDTYGYTVEALVAQAQSEAAYNRLYEYLTKDIEVTDDDVIAHYASIVAGDKATYEGDLAAYTLQCMYGDRPTYTPEGIRTVKHILIKYKDDDTQKISELNAMSEKPADYAEQYEALKQQAYANVKDKIDEIMGKIEAGEDFDALVEEYGEDPGMKSEPYKAEGYMVFSGCTNLVAEFVDSAMALEKIGDVTAEPALTEYGAHIMLYFSDMTPGEVELTDEKAEALRSELFTQKESDVFNGAIEARKAEMGAVYKYPENLVEAARGEAADAADEDAAAETVVVEG